MVMTVYVININVNHYIDLIALSIASDRQGSSAHIFTSPCYCDRSLSGLLLLSVGEIDCHLKDLSTCRSRDGEYGVEDNPDLDQDHLLCA